MVSPSGTQTRSQCEFLVPVCLSWTSIAHMIDFTMDSDRKSSMDAEGSFRRTPAPTLYSLM